MGKWARPGDSVVKAMEQGHDQPQWRIILNVAGQSIRSYEAQLEAYLAEVRRAHRECSSELIEIERQLTEASASLEQLSGATDAAQMNTEQTVQVVELSERRQALRQQQTWLAERLVDLLNTARKLQAVIRQSQISSRYLETDTGEVEADDGQLDSRCQLRAIEAQEEERLRLAREIHDGPAQVLANAIFEIEYCQRLLNRDPERLSTELERLKIDLKEGLAEVRQFIMDLRPGPLAELGLIATIRRYAQNYESRFGIVVELALDEDLGRLLPTQEVGVFRVVQEALQNARRHSGATRVRLAMRRQEGCI